MFTYEKSVRSLQLYEQTHSITAIIRILGYPGRQTLYRWIRQRNVVPKEKSVFRETNTPQPSHHPPLELKLEVLHRCFELEEDVKSVSNKIGYSRASIYTWQRKYL